MEILLNQMKFQGTALKTEHAAILLIQGTRANLGCGYFSLAPAEKLKDRFAIVTGVKNFEDMLEAKVVSASQEALHAGVIPGVTNGREALIRMESV